MNKEKLAEIYRKYNLEKEDIFKHQHYLIITRSGIEKIMGVEEIQINYEVIKCERDFVVIKALGQKENVKIETFGSAIKGASFRDGNTNSYYVTEIAEKRAMSRIVLKITGLYELGIFGEDESEDFKKPQVQATTPQPKAEVKLIFNTSEFEKTKKAILMYVEQGLTLQQIKAKMDVRYSEYTNDALKLLKIATKQTIIL
jgi:hypothetical protein